MKPKLKLIVPVVVLLVLAGAGYKFVLAKPKDTKAEPKPHVEGKVYVLGKEFLVNLADGRFAKFSVALVLAPDDHSTAPLETGGHSAPPKPPEGYGAMHQEALVRSLILDAVTDAKDTQLVEAHGREELLKKILKNIKKKTDVHAHEVVFTDLTVQ